MISNRLIAALLTLAGADLLQVKQMYGGDYTYSVRRWGAAPILLGAVLTGLFLRWLFTAPPHQPFISPLAAQAVEVSVPSPSPTTAPEPTPEPATRSVVEQAILDTFGEHGEAMIQVAYCESGLQPHNWYNKWAGASWETAKENGYAVGLFMIYTKVHTQHVPEDLLDLDYNLKAAKALFDASGFNPWLASNHCHQLLDN